MRTLGIEQTNRSIETSRWIERRAAKVFQSNGFQDQQLLARDSGLRNRTEIPGKAEEEWPEKWRNRDKGRAEKKLKEKQEMTRGSLSSDIGRSHTKKGKTRLKSQTNHFGTSEGGRVGECSAPMNRNFIFRIFPWQAPGPPKTRSE